MIASMKVFLVFDYKRDFVYLSEIQKSIDLLKNENSKLRIEYILLSNSLSIDQPAKREYQMRKIDVIFFIFIICLAVPFIKFFDLNQDRDRFVLAGKFRA